MSSHSGPWHANYRITLGSYEIKGAGAETRLVAVEEDPSPVEIGRGWLDAMLYIDTRIAGSAIRCGWLDSRDKNRSGTAEFVEVPWDEALDLLADELGRVHDTRGNDVIFASSYGWASAGRQCRDRASRVSVGGGRVTKP